jgi:hypothetical protein
MLWLFLGLVLVSGAVGFAVRGGAELGVAAGVAAAGIVICALYLVGYDVNDPEAPGAVVKAYSSPAAVADAFAEIIGFGGTVIALLIGFIGGYFIRNAESAQ